MQSLSDTSASSIADRDTRSLFEFQAQLSFAVQSLPLEWQKIWAMRDQGHTFKEIAAAIEKSPGYTHKCYCLIKDHILSYFSDREDLV